MGAQALDDHATLSSAAARGIPARPGAPSIDADIEAVMVAQARRTVIAARKMRVRRFIRFPWQLDAVWPGLSAGDPRTGLPDARRLIEIAGHILAVERGLPRPRFGFGGEVPLLNAQAVMLYGRALRRLQARSA